MKILMLVLLVVCSCAVISEARSSGSHGYRNNHYQGVQDFRFKKNEWKRLNSGY